MALRIDHLTRTGPTRRILDGLSLEVGEGECLALLGAPGSGRASLLRILAGLEEADEGRILLDGRDITRLPPRRRRIGYLFRQDPLLGHPSVFDAVAAALPVPEEGAVRDAPARVHRLLALTGLDQDPGWMPAMLPPAKRHRLAAARVLAAEPRVLLVAEAFGLAGFGRPRSPPRLWLKALQARLGLMMVLVAQGPAEAAALGDRVALLDAGRVAQVGPPDAVLGPAG